jgi:hypothetical protein
MLRGGRRSLRRGRRRRGTVRSKGWLRRGRLWTAVAGLTVLATSGMALSADAAASPAPINGCYLPLANPAQLYVVTKAGSSTCPRGWVAVTWNTTGAQGPAGLGTGVTASGTHVPVDGSPGAAITVLTGPSTPARVSTLRGPFSSSGPNGFPGCSITCFNS